MFVLGWRRHPKNNQKSDEVSGLVKINSQTKFVQVYRVVVSVLTIFNPHIPTLFSCFVKDDYIVCCGFEAPTTNYRLMLNKPLAVKASQRGSSPVFLCLASSRQTSTRITLSITQKSPVRIFGRRRLLAFFGKLGMSKSRKIMAQAHFSDRFAIYLGTETFKISGIY